jgi:acyl-CoA reductase-like NAD-dependent aldehyde dehydrogenase
MRADDCWPNIVPSGNASVQRKLNTESMLLSGLYAASLVKEAGFPPGVINVLSDHGRVIGQTIASHMKIDRVLFTGSIRVGHAKKIIKGLTMDDEINSRGKL